jgi:retinol-binding protein 3
MNRTWLTAHIPVIALLLLQLVLPPSSLAQETPRLDTKLVQDTIKSVGAIIRDEYFDAELAASVNDSLQERVKQGRYADATTTGKLAANLTKDLLELTHDKHLAVEARRSGPSENKFNGVSDESRETVGRRANFGLQRVEVLSGNVAYLKLNSFYRPNEAREVISAAMRTIRNADALILDLRDNGGGSPDTVAFFASYFFSKQQLPLFKIVPRSGEKRVYETEFAELPECNEGRPMYVLTSARTFSAGEGMAFLLQERRRAEVVGETTAGAANPGRSYRVNEHFDVTVPNGRIHTVLDGKNWEGDGVIPDVKVTADDALRTAHVRALSHLLKQTNDENWRDTLQEYVKALAASRS